MIKLLEHTRRPDITFRRDGRISIAARVARILSIRPGDNLNIATDGDECLLFAIPGKERSGRHVASCYPSKKGGYNLRANSTALCRAMLELSRIEGDRAAFSCGDPIIKEGRLYIPIINKMPL